MDVSKYRDMFIAESQEHLQTLNEALLKLEKDPRNVELLGQIFRVAHTLKGMAATMGFEQITELSHKMENVLDRLRTGEVVATSETIDVLLECFDLLEHLVDDIATNKQSEVDLTPLLDKLKMLSSAPAGRIIKEKKKKKETEVKGYEVTIEGQLDEFEQRALAEAVQKGFEGLKITVTLDKECMLKSARAFMVFKGLEQCGEVIKSIPSAEEIEDEKFDYQFEVFLLTKEGRDRVITELESISEVEKIDIFPLTLEEAKPKEIAKMVTAPEVTEAIPSVAERKITAAKTQSVRVDIAHLDTLVNLVGELAITRSSLAQTSRTYSIDELSSSLDQL
ncbi:MAG: Hpt domain-containing protein, partial [Desulfobacteraceae bacterium]|nr:Hpt domain-containing protein [Desulfobacteraceae bacterium]